MEKFEQQRIGKEQESDFVLASSEPCRSIHARVHLQGKHGSDR